MKSACLQTSYFPQDHTREHIAEALQDVLSSWKLNPEKLVAVTIDNGANVVKAVQLNKWLRMQCFGHRLHLAIRHQLITESATRWGSGLVMIERVLVQERALAKVLSADKKTRPLVFIWQDIEVLEAIQKALKPLQDFTDALSGEDYVTLSYVRPVLHLFNNRLMASEEGDSELCKSIKTKVVDYLNNKYADPTTSDLLDIASLLDPRFRAKYISCDKMDALKRRVILETQSLLHDQDECMRELNDPTEQEGAAVAVPPDPKRKKSLASFFKEKARWHWWQTHTERDNRT
uniref:Transposase n=1 Tax=Knipowitschia caucasica TaxID=637954 RepID=A0AAV2K8K1_KNICA